jgi:hypothetical protein
MATAQHVYFDFEEERFKELIVFISELCKHDSTYGSIKLNKILYFADFMAYRVLGRPITGARYLKLPEGPVPREIIAARNDLIAEGRMAVELRPYFNGVQKRPVVVGDGPNESGFSESERAIVRSIADYFHGKTAREVSDFSHLQPGWILAEDGADIPYETAWLSSDPVDQMDEAIAQEMADKYFR